MSTTIEHKLLSKLVDPAECAKVWDMGLRENAFEDLTCRAAYGWMIEYWRNANMALAPTWVVMEHEFPTLKLENTVDESAEWMVGALQQRYLVNQAQEAMITAAKTLDADPEATVSKLWRNIYDLSESTVPRTVRADMSTNVEARRAWYAPPDENTALGAPFGFPELDAHTRGILPGELAACAAYTKIGKTWLLAKATLEGRRSGFRPLIFSLEMTAKEMQKRIDALASGVSFTRLDVGDLLPAEREDLHRAQDELATLGPLWVERPPRGDRTVTDMVSRARQLGSNYLLIDQLSWIDGDRDYTGDRALTAKHGDNVFGLKEEIARESAGAIPGLLAVQLNRETMRSRDNGGRGELQHFANSSMIEQTVDIAVGLWRNEHMRDNNQMGIDIMGARRVDRQSWLAEWRLNERTRLRITEINSE
jgi:replicative DNA helicase